MRGEFCVGAASILSFVSLLLLIFVHVSQINTSTVPRGISLVKINVSAYGDALHQAIVDPVDGLYTTNASAPFESGAGLRQFYLFGLYAHCGYINSTEGTCTNKSIQNQFTPYAALTSDMPAITLSSRTLSCPTILDDPSRHNMRSGGSLNVRRPTTSPNQLNILLGAVCSGVAKYSATFFLSTFAAIIGSIFLLIGATIWTVIIKKTQAVNSAMLGATSPVPVGIEVSIGKGLYLIWAAFVTLLFSAVPT
ncbi:hypothetical protein K438DRAFT_2009685 [Mycena galopus ATCC 62051]|nr:hypothetical protein K438DRAFT_2009685 [Mycena galopus ATCC 62051]